MNITTADGQIFEAYQCKHIGVAGDRCTVRFSDKNDIPLHMKRHDMTDDACIGTEDQKRPSRLPVFTTKPRPRKRILVTGAGMGRIKLTDYSHGRKKH